MHEVWFGDWSAKDMLAHIASWDEFVALDMHRIGRGHIPCIASFKEGEVDSWNGFLMRPRRLWPLVQVRSEAQHCHEALLEALNTLPEPMFVPPPRAQLLEIAATTIATTQETSTNGEAESEPRKGRYPEIH
jgi:hypothetical protein